MPEDYSQDELKQKEEDGGSNDSPTAAQPHENQVGKGFTGSGTLAPGRFSLRGRLTRRRALFGGGMVATIIFLVMALFSIGPLEFVQIAKRMEMFHFSAQEDAGDGRMGKMYRYARSGGNAGETRLGWLGSKMTNNMLADLEKIGLKPVFTSKTNVYQGFEIDKSSKNSPFKDMDNQEIREALKGRGVNIKEIKFSGRKATITVSGYINQRRSLKFLVDQMGNDKIPGALRVRVLSRYGLVTWHPLKKLDRKLNEKLSVAYDKWSKAREERLQTGRQKATVDGTRAKEIGPNGERVDNPGEKTNDLKQAFKEIGEGKTLKVAGGAAAGVGAVCLVRDVNDNIGEIRYRQVIAPLIRIGMEAVTVGNQVMSGTDIDSDVVSFMSKNFSDGKSTWAQATPILAQQGISGGTDIAQGVKQSIGKGAPSWISWAGSNKFKQLCSTAGQITAGTITIVVSAFTGGLVTLAGQAAASALILPQVIDKLSAFLAGDSVNVIAKGAEWGNLVDFGSRLGGNAMALMQGGAELSKDEERQLTVVQNEESQTEFQKKNLAYKLLSPTDPQAPMAKLISNLSPEPSQSISQMATAFLHFGSIFTNFQKIVFSPVKAASINYNYGFPAYGFSLGDQQNPLVADPYANAEQVAKILDSSSGEAYIKRAEKCFGINLTKVAGDDNKARWDAVPGDKPANPYDPRQDHFPRKECSDGSNDWLRIRFFILDTGIMEGYACYKSYDQACADEGVVSSEPSPSTTTVSGSSQELAQQILNNPNIDISASNFCRSCTEDISNTANGEAAYNNVTLDVNLLRFLLDLGRTTKVDVNSITGKGVGHSENSNHYKGIAIDFACSIDVDVADSVGDKYGIKRYSGEKCPDDGHWHYSTTGH